MPWRTAAGVLGMERTTLAVAPRWLAKYFSVLPAAIDRNTEPSSAKRFRSGSTPSIDCGLTASTTMPGVLATSEVEGTGRRPGVRGLSASPGSATTPSAAGGPGARPQRTHRPGDDDIGGRDPAPQPAFQHGTAHLAATDEEKIAHGFLTCP